MVEPKQYKTDVLIVGAGISGIASAYHLKEKCPNHDFMILEGMESYGGTWLTHKYPGVRSDSDLYTFGYSFKPWTGVPIASAEEILTYMGEVITESKLNDQLYFNHKIVNADWQAAKKCWVIKGVFGAENQPFVLEANVLWMAAGYYDHKTPYTPEFPGMSDFDGEIIHPQHWPEDLDYSDKQVVVIGSGATAATIIPAMAGDTKHITMLQRSPTYFVPLENKNELADTLRQIDVPEALVHDIVRKKILFDAKQIHEASNAYPDLIKAELLKTVRGFLGEEFDIEKHFTPSYRPWQQRIACVPNGDLFAGINAGKASVVTDQIDRFVSNGILLKSGEVLEADIIVTATGFNLAMVGGVQVSLEGEPVDFASMTTYRGVLFSGMPNFINIFGYLRTSWTMRAELVAEYVCRLLTHMDEKGVCVVTPELRDSDADMERKPFISPDDFNPGYLQRAGHLMPKQGDRSPWQFSQDYYREVSELPVVSLDDDVLKYS
ncbi:MAG: NAD(P)/FAD-dependent oxidoreductase [Pseudomonadales bacterium]|jgi:cation diffusion facilitator CzcD-associated flavoprotein CzcO